MAIVNGYCTLVELKAELKIADTTDDAPLELAVETASRWLDEMCGWRFHSTSSDETRTFTAKKSSELQIPEGLISITTLKCDQDGNRTYEETWATTDYDLLPENAALDAEPYRSIELAPQGLYSFSLYKKGVQIVGKFGYCLIANVPMPIKRACVLKAQQLFMRKGLPFGVMASSAQGTLTMKVPEDGDILSLLTKYRRSIT